MEVPHPIRLTVAETSDEVLAAVASQERSGYN
jgi:hypothetical protein